jgi:hypothetical protein
VDISDQAIFKTIYHWPFQSIGIVNFTGGEPSLRPDRIRQLWQELLWQRKAIEGWELTTNAKYITQDFLDALDRITGISEEKSLCGIRISDDSYHKRLRDRDDRYKLYDWGELNDVHVYTDSNLNNWPDKTLGMGRAKRFQLGDRQPDPATKEWQYWINEDDELGYCDGYFYVNALGQVIDGCDFSYLEQKKRVLGSVFTDNPEDIIRRNGHRTGPDNDQDEDEGGDADGTEELEAEPDDTRSGEQDQRDSGRVRDEGDVAPTLLPVGVGQRHCEQGG